MTQSSIGLRRLQKPPTTRWAPARWSPIRWQSSMPNFVSMALRACGSPMPRSVLRPALAVAYRKHVDMAVEREVAARLPGRERRDDVRHRLLWRDHAILYAAPFQQIADMPGCRARVAGRVGLGQRLNWHKKSISTSPSHFSSRNNTALRSSIANPPRDASAAV